jgi:hypothetical protein
MILAPDAGTYATRTPYVTLDEFKDSLTGVLVGPQATMPADLVLGQILGRASSMADGICHQVLAATLNTEAGIYPVHDHQIRVPLRQTPIVAVASVAVGETPQTVTPLTDLTGVWINLKTVTIPTLLPVTSVFARVSYVNGWANTTLSIQAVQGALQLTVTNPLGFIPGMTVNITDTSPETVTIDQAYEPGSTVIPLTAPTVNLHLTGASISTMPLSIKQAVISLATALVKTPGAEAVIMGAIRDKPNTIAEAVPGIRTDLQTAQLLLREYGRVI